LSTLIEERFYHASTYFILKLVEATQSQPQHTGRGNQAMGAECQMFLILGL